MSECGLFLGMLMYVTETLAIANDKGDEIRWGILFAPSLWQMEPQSGSHEGHEAKHGFQFPS